MRNLIDSFIKTKAYIHLIVISGFALISLSFYYPVLSGKILLQSDIRQYSGMARQLMEYREKTGKETFWIERVRITMEIIFPMQFSDSWEKH